jgi:hypothetical protein
MRTHLTPLALCAVAIGSIAGCGSGSITTTVAQSRRVVPSTTTHLHTVAIRNRRPVVPAPPSYPRLLPSATGSTTTGFVPAVTVRGHRAVWIIRHTNAALLAFDQRLVGLRLHSGTVDAGSSGWRFGPLIAGTERRQLVAAFNGGFKLDVGAGGFQSYGRVGSPLSDGLGSIVTYADGLTDIGSWHQGVPAPGVTVVSVRQNVHLLIDGGRPAANLGCLLCWGATLHGVIAPARSALGITADGRLVWAGGENLTVQDLALALLGAKVVRAVELDINPEWVAAYLYGPRGGNGPLAPVPIVRASQARPDNSSHPTAAISSPSWPADADRRVT